MWNDFQSKEFMFAERKGFIIYPDCEPIGRMILKTEYLGAFPAFDIAMLKKGYYLIHINHRSRWAPDEETHIMADFVRHCAEELNASPKCILDGMSCGGLQAARFAQLYPELTAVMYLDAPVLNILSMAGLGDFNLTGHEGMWQEIVAAYGVNKSSIVNFRKSPIDFMDVLIRNNIPMLLMYGSADTTVIYGENGKVFEDYYKEHGGTMKVISRSMSGHHPHGLEDPTIMIEFVEQFF